MKYATIIGLLLTAIGLLLYILQEPDYTEGEFYIGVMLGAGVGMLLGGFMGWAQKKRKKVVEPKFEPKTESTFKNPEVKIEKDDSGLKL